MHEKGGMELALAMSSQYSTKQLYDILEMLDVHDCMVEQAREKEKNSKQK